MRSAELSPMPSASNYTKLKLRAIVQFGNMAEIKKYKPN
jgi:hypothetical protein